MDKDKKTENEESCCSSGGKCGGCGCRCTMALILLLLGGIVGYLLGSHCGSHGMRGMACPFSMSTPPPAAK